MTIQKILLFFAAILPPIVLCIHIYVMDEYEQEPFKDLLKLFLCGAVMCLPAGILNEVALEGIKNMFVSFFSDDGLVGNGTYYAYIIVRYILGVGLVEEGLKLLGLYGLTKKSEEFDYFFDGIVYAVFISLGFATLENIMYAFEYGWNTILSRAIFSIPGHMSFGVMMGYYYSLGNVYEKAANIESRLEGLGLVHFGVFKKLAKKAKWKAFLIPVLIHGIYDICCTLLFPISTIAFLVIVMAMYYNCYIKLTTIAERDDQNLTLVEKVVVKKYPLHAETIKQEIAIYEDSQEDPIFPY